MDRAGGTTVDVRCVAVLPARPQNVVRYATLGGPAVIPDTTNITDLRKHVRHWLSQLAAGNYASAVQSLDGTRWSADSLREAVERGLALPSVVTDPATATGSDRANIIPLNGGRGYSVWVAVPLNGVWSDLTVQFTFSRQATCLSVTLDDVCVL